MTVFFILLLLALIAGGYYVYQRLLTIEREIRADQRALAEDQSASQPAHTETETEPEEPVAEAVEVATLADGSLESQILALVEESPGMSQPELYAAFTDSDRRELQKILREMDQQGRLRREKKGNSYRLHPL